MNEKLYQQTVTQMATEFPLSITILCYVAVAVLLIILIMLFRISSQVGEFSNNFKKSTRPSSSPSASSDTPPETEAPAIEVGPGTPFEEFLNEDLARRELPKKEQFKAYRKWRADKGLNWSA